MAFTQAQVKQLEAKLNGRYVKTREANGATLTYLEGWHVIAEANRIFGFDGWDRRTIATDCVWTGVKNGTYQAAYTAKVRISVCAGDRWIVREGSGTGESKARSPGEAHELALKTAETDATKRALATFGNPFGLALYDPEHAQVRKARTGQASQQLGPWTLRSAEGVPGASYDLPQDFAAALRTTMAESPTIDQLFAVWEQNLEAVRAVHRNGQRSRFMPDLVTHLKACASALVERVQSNAGQAEKQVEPKVMQTVAQRGKIDKSVLTLSEPKRIRCKEHLRYVASQPCLICGRKPSYAHHVRYAQPRALARKVSDEFTVPLCAIHHRDVHNTGDERGWWERQGIDPLAMAKRLWDSAGRKGVDVTQDPVELG